MRKQDTRRFPLVEIGLDHIQALLLPLLKGGTIADVRYARRYSIAFRRNFEQGYRDAGGTLPEDWWRTAKLLDAIRLVAILNEERDLPVVFADCRELIEAVVGDW
jgi:hypothetical protein